jgi:putative acetyltransferase
MRTAEEEKCKERESMIRAELPGDREAIHKLHAQAFGSGAEGDLVDAIRAHRGMEISLVAEECGEIIGHVLFTAVLLTGQNTIQRGAALGPVAVVPDCQGRGIGSSLIRRGLKVLQERNCPVVVVLGDPEFYSRFGFVPATQFNLESKYDKEHFMALLFEEKRLPPGGASVRYRYEFDQEFAR